MRNIFVALLLLAAITVEGQSVYTAPAYAGSPDSGRVAVSAIGPNGKPKLYSIWLSRIGASAATDTFYFYNAKSPTGGDSIMRMVGANTAVFVKIKAGSGMTITSSTIDTTLTFAAATAAATDVPVLAMQALGSVIKGNTVGGSLATINSPQALTDAQVGFVAIYLPTAATLTGVKFLQVAQGVYTADQNNYVALYSYSGGNITQVAISANDGNIWKGTANSVQTVPFASTYAASAGTYFVGFLYNSSAQTTAPTLGVYPAANTANLQNGDFTNSAKLVSTLAAQTALTTPIAMSALSVTAARFWFGVY